MRFWQRFWQAIGTRERLAVVVLGVVLGYLGSCIIRFLHHDWILNAAGAPQLTDFVAVWSAGKLAHAGQAASAYAPQLMHSAEAATLGHAAAGRFDWPYPPFYFFVVAPLALLSYPQAFLAWAAAGVAGYGAAVSAAANSRTAALFALAAPWSLANLTIGQNGFLTATLMGLFLLQLEARPAMAGLLLGLLACKPQLGLLIPLALAAGGYWRGFAWACATVAGLTALSAAIFGPATLTGFAHALTTTGQTLLVSGMAGWYKLQSAYGVARWFGLPAAAGWLAQAVVTLCCVVAVARLWRGHSAFALKAAGLCVAALLATPYVFAYDLPMLGVAVAFLHRERPLDALEGAALGFAVLGFAATLLWPAPTPFLATLTVAALVLRRMGQGDAVSCARSWRWQRYGPAWSRSSRR